MPAKAVHRQALVETAMRLFRRQGYASTGLNQILSESQAPKGSLYYYFPGGKEALAVAAVELAGSLLKDMLVRLSVERRTRSNPPAIATPGSPGLNETVERYQP